MKTKYPDDWDSRRRKVYERDGWTCQNCGCKGGPEGDNELHAHHVVPKSEGGSDELSNLSTLCRDCHQNAHDHDIGSDRNSSEGSNWAPFLSLVAYAVSLYYLDDLIPASFIEPLPTELKIVVALLGIWVVTCVALGVFYLVGSSKKERNTIRRILVFSIVYTIPWAVAFVLAYHAGKLPL